MKYKNYTRKIPSFFPILLVLMLGTCSIQSLAQEEVTNKESITQNTPDTSQIIVANWAQLTQAYQLGDTATFHNDLATHQALAHQYGFRFDQNFESNRLNFTYHQLFDELFILEDPTNSLTIEAIQQSKYQNQFIGNHSESTIQRDLLNFFPIPTAYNVKNTYWVKLNTINLSNSQAEAWLMVGWNERSWENIAVYEDDGRTVKRVGRSGLRTPISNKIGKDWRNFVHLKVPPQSRYTYYFKLEGVFFPKYPDRIAFYHFDEEAYWSKKSFSLFEDGVFLGVTFILLLIIVVLYFYNREQDTLFFALQLVGIWLHDFSDTEHVGASNFFNELFPGALEMGHFIAVLGFLMLTHGSILFMLTFLDAQKYAPKIKKWTLRILYLLQILYIFLAIFNIGLHNYANYPYHWIVYYISFFLLLLASLPLMVFALAIVAWQKKHPLAKFFSIAYLPIIIGYSVGFGGEAFFNNFTASNSFQILMRMGYLVTYFLFTVAIFYKRQLERKEILEKRLALSIKLEQEQQEAQRLKELDSFKTRLYTNLTHEFRTPLTVILGMTKQLTNMPQKKLATAVKMIERNGQSLLQLINQLLDLSKLENKAFQLNLQRSDLIPFLKYVTESFQSAANSQNLSLRFQTNLERLEMDFAPQQMTQIMSNLLSNALKFTASEGKITVAISRKEDLLFIKVADNGIGIPAEKLLYIFDRFYQVDNSSTRKGEGTGIGLAHTKELIKLMGGTIKVESILGEGTTFLVQLKISQKAESVPVKQLYPTHLKEKNSTSKVITTTSADVKKDNLPQILIIEDNPDVIVYLQSCLANEYELSIAYNGSIGIEKALAAIPDIIISDVMMPDKDGYEVCDTLKQDERTSHIPIILLTARADAESRNIGFSKGADAYLTKPFDKEELMIRLRQMIQKKERLLAFLSVSSKGEYLQKEDQQTILIEDAFVQKVRTIVERHYTEENFALPQLCQKIGMSRSQLFRKMKALINVSPSSFIRNYRMQQAKLLLESGEWNVSEVTYRVGLKDISHFSRIFQETFGYPPSTAVDNKAAKDKEEEG